MTVGDTVRIYDCGFRHGKVLAVIGNEFLLEYRIRALKTRLAVCVVRSGRTEPQAYYTPTSLPRLWRCAVSPEDSTAPDRWCYGVLQGRYVCR